MIRVGLAEDNQQFCELLQEFFENHQEIQIVGVAYNGLDALELVQNNTMDVLLLDMIMPKLDGIGVLERIRPMNDRPRVIIFSAFGHDEMTRKAVELGADYFIVKPFGLEILAQRIVDIAKAKQMRIESVNKESNMIEVERQVSQILHKLRIPAHFKGYAYLREAIMECVVDPGLVNEVTKKLYPQIAEKFDTTHHRVERAIRFAIETACGRGELDFLYQLMGYTVDEKKGKPTNASFIAKVADQIRLANKVQH
ncbi:MAG TPA: sporulation transcription factor Spo0A [Bacillota bacterium]|jgi:two-component system response regulator (stage 0 sporulation protein A)|nr:sporulation transcription factor Spo0A [Bacillota bacterium]